MTVALRFLEVLMFESSEDFTVCRIFQSRRLEVTAVVLTVWSEVCILRISDGSVTVAFSLTAPFKKCTVVLYICQTRGLKHREG